MAATGANRHRSVVAEGHRCHMSLTNEIDAGELGLGGTLAASPDARASMGEHRLLIVDDDEELLGILARIVRQRVDGLQVDVCDSAEEALGLLGQVEYDVILTDIAMPGIGGLELLARIRAQRPQTPTILMTGHKHH